MPLPPVLEVTRSNAKKNKKKAEQHRYVGDTYSSFLEMYTMWNMGEPLLGGASPLKFWDQSVMDYAVLAKEVQDPNDPVEQYQTTISRDKTDDIYANLSSKFFYPSCIAQNSEQSIDRTLGKVGDATLYWQYKQDGWPSESGQQKNARLVHKACVEGTAYTLDLVDEDGYLNSELIPNEEVFYPNLWQPNIQLQKRVYRAKLNMTVGEAEELFGDYEAWDEVDTTGGWTDAFQITHPALKGLFDGIVQNDKISILYVWERATQKQLKEMKRKRKVDSKAKRAWYYNVIVNNVPMFSIENVSPYKSGFLPISKMIFEPMAKTEYALGNSVPNKCKEDKRWKDAWKTNLRWRGQLAGMPPQLVIGGHLDGEEVMIPSQFTSVPEGVTVEAVPGIVPITSTDIQLMNMADQEIDRSTMEPSPSGDQAARTAMIQQANAQAMLQPFTQQLAFFAASRSMHILTASFQRLPKGSLAKIVVPDQTLDDGLTGTFEVIFKEPEDVLMSEVDNDEFENEKSQLDEAGIEHDQNDLRRLMHSMKMQQKNQHSRKANQPTDRIYVSPTYLKDLRFYLFADAANAMQDRDAMAKMNFQQAMPLMLQDQTGSIVPREVWHEYVRIMGLNDRLLSKGNQAPAPQMPQQAGANPQAQGGMPPGMNPSGMTQAALGPNEAANAAAIATTGKPVGALSGV